MMSINEILKDFRSRIASLYGSRLKELILYGSWARGRATPDSDIDVVVQLEGKIRAGEEIDRMIDIITDLNLKYGVLLSVYPVSTADYSTVKSPLLLNVLREGKAV
ncbi:MAG: nucleotidyltransferase domain-containing protein [Elusimicrobia bacterium]|nr:nucleotidyltransferase domain-containing protein [Candidatus Obscuribacterium magneticum]